MRERERRERERGQSKARQDRYGKPNQVKGTGKGWVTYQVRQRNTEVRWYGPRYDCGITPLAANEHEMAIVYWREGYLVHT